MKKPDATTMYSLGPHRLRRLIERAGHTQLSAAAAIGIDGRTMRRYLSLDHASYRSPPYVVQYAIEGLVFGDEPDKTPAVSWRGEL